MLAPLQEFQGVENRVSEEIRLFYDGTGYEAPQSKSETEGPLHLPRPYSVYVIECDGYGAPEEFKVEAEEMLDYYSTLDGNEDWSWGGELSSWMWAAYYASQRFYVGFTTDPYRRLREHVGSHNSALFTTIFQPERLVDIEWYSDESAAREREEEYAEQLRENRRDVFVSQA